MPHRSRSRRTLRLNRYVFVSLIITGENPSKLLEQAKTFMRVDGSFDDDLITTLLESAFECFEAITNNVIIESNYQTFRDDWQSEYQMRKNPYLATTFIKYKDEDAVEQTLDSVNFYDCLEDGYSRIVFDFVDPVPTLQGRCEDIKIDFTVGLSDTIANIQSDLKIALFNHVNFMYVNRGDCGCDTSVSSIPSQALSTYMKFKVQELGQCSGL